MQASSLELIAAARAVCGAFALDYDLSAGAVGAALRTAAGRVYTGVSVELGCGLGFCAEVAAIADMLKHRETRIVEIVAVKGERIVPPCGRCRETLAQIDPGNLDTRVIVAEDRDIALRELLPAPWTVARKGGS
ncbi:MAG: hypothetical protein JSW68_12900 [Burkholderiales bacterium]|nr:MAG: hypothetical protein JSW68_12900 [Burkholderiales bacterium]